MLRRKLIESFTETTNCFYPTIVAGNVEIIAPIMIRSTLATMQKTKTPPWMYEDRFILNTARINLSEENILNLQELSQKDIDWTVFEQKACIHGVDTFIYYSLKNHNLKHLIPAETFRHFQENFYRNAVRNSIFIEEINRLSEIIQDKIVLLKGADLMKSLYPNIAIRTMGDIDILVEREKVNDTWNKLQSNGFTCHYNSLPKSTVHKKIIQDPEHLPALNNSKCNVEVHWNIFQKFDFFDATALAWENSVPINKERNIFRLSTEYLLVHLCSHFYSHKNRMVPLRMFCDINELICKYSSTFDWSEVDTICTHPVLREKVTTALTYAHGLFGTLIPKHFVDESLVDAEMINLDSLLEVTPIHSPMKSSINCIFFNLKLLSPTDRLIFIFRTFFPTRKWINATYNVKSTPELPVAYYKYWLHLFRCHILKQNISYAD